MYNYLPVQTIAAKVSNTLIMFLSVWRVLIVCADIQLICTFLRKLETKGNQSHIVRFTRKLLFYEPLNASSHSYQVD